MSDGKTPEDAPENKQAATEDSAAGAAADKPGGATDSPGAADNADGVADAHDESTGTDKADKKKPAPPEPTPDDSKTTLPADSEPTLPDDSAPAMTEPKRKRSLWLPVAILIIVVAAIGYFLLQQGGTPDEPAAQTDTAERAVVQTQSENLIPAASIADIDKLRDEMRALNNNVGELSTALDAANEALARQTRDNERLKDSIEQRVDLLDSLPGRVENTEDALATLQGISAGSRNAWLLAEAEYYMQIANAQVQLANNPQLAATALELADQRIRELGDPAYTPVRRAMSSEIAALKAVAGTDIEGVTLTLGSLASMVATLPLINEIDVPEDSRNTPDLDTLSGWQRMKASVNSALSGLVRIRQSDERVKAMLSPEAEYFLRLNLQLQLQAARLSLLLSETAGFRQSLQDASGWMREYFDRNDPAVQNALKMIDNITDTQIVVQRPDVSESLRLLRQQRTVEAIAE